MNLRAKLAAIDRIETMVRESAKPLDHISDIRITHVDGSAAAPRGRTPATRSAASRSGGDDERAEIAVQAPLVQSLLQAAGIKPDD